MNGVAPVPTAEMAVDERAALSAAACMCPAPPSRRLESQHPESPDLPGRFTQVLRRPLESTQFRSHAYVRMLRQAQLRGSMGRVGACADNAHGVLLSLLQKNVLNRQRWQTRE
jgi:hypothetical protein